MFGDHGLGGLLEEGGHGKSPKCLSRNLGDFGKFCKGLKPFEDSKDREERLKQEKKQQKEFEQWCNDNPNLCV